jgi:superfamily II DNA/RNA helicase
MGGPLGFRSVGPVRKTCSSRPCILDWSFVISSFTDLGVDAAVNARLEKLGITTPLPIQSATIPAALAGRDICGKAPTGSGKTLAFGMPIVAHLEQSRPRRPRALILVPTRELASQVHAVLGTLLGRDANRVVSIFGGTGYRDQVRALHKGANVVVACPGRLEDLIERGDVRLDDVTTVVLDEADRMSDMGFLPAVRRLMDQTSPNRQVLLFSATIGREVESIIRSYQHDPVRVNIEADEDEKADVTHHFWKVERGDRVGIVAKLVAEHGQAFVFCRTKRGADRVVRQLQALGVRAVPMHGDRSQGQREKALDSFTKGRADALVATDVVARGIHVDDVPCVVHFDPPPDDTDYVHRSGRTGRAGRTGTVVTLVTDEQRKDMQVVQRALGMEQGLVAPFSTPMVARAPERVERVTTRPTGPASRPTDRPSERVTERVTARQPGRAESRNRPKSRSKTGPGKLRGTVKFFNGARGYGFLAREGGGDLFVHHSQIEGPERQGLAEGLTVEFTIAPGRKGEEARNVKVV